LDNLPPVVLDRSPYTMAEFITNSIVQQKDQGNVLFGECKYDQSLAIYTKALSEIDVVKHDTPENIQLWSTILSNRAAVYLRLERPMLAMLDCNAILQHNPSHVKALYRRASALEIMEKYESALVDLRSLLDLEVDKVKEKKIKKMIVKVREKSNKQNGTSTISSSNGSSSSSGETKDKNNTINVSTDTKISSANNETKEIKNVNNDEDEDDDEDEDEDEMDEDVKRKDVQLGFVEEIDDAYPILHLDKNWKNWDGGKVGGYPIWLDPSMLPAPTLLQCTVCLQKMNLLMQIYAPIDEKINDDENEKMDIQSKREKKRMLNERAFHRSLYVFCCRNGKCLEKSSEDGSSSGLCVLRCQMSQKNEFYDENPMDSDDDDCDNYDRKSVTMETKNLVHDQPFVEFDVVTESEQYNKEQSDASIMESVNNVSELNVDEGEITSKDTKEAMKILLENPDGSSNRLIDEADTNMIKFHTITSIAGDQVLRYSRWDEYGPLWVSNVQTKKEDAVPICPECGHQRKFEFQIMPQLLNFLKPHEIGGIGEIDWGTLVVYTCSNSCSTNSSTERYTKEYIYRQPM
jgi:pre-rRNA-processing protein TSR4